MLAFTISLLVARSIMCFDPTMKVMPKNPSAVLSYPIDTDVNCTSIDFSELIYRRSGLLVFFKEKVIFTISNYCVSSIFNFNLQIRNLSTLNY